MMGRASKRKQEMTRAERLAGRMALDHEARHGRHSAAYHEAAHVVVALLMGQEIEYVELSGIGSGFTKYRSPAWYQQMLSKETRPPRESLSPEQVRYIQGRILVSLAAYRMEQALAQVDKETYVPETETDIDDRHQASILAHYLAGGDREAMQRILDGAYLRVQEMLEENMAALAALAERLKREGRVSGEEVHGLLEVV